MVKKSKFLKFGISLCIYLASLFIVCNADASSEWLLYDDGTAAHESSDFPYQGVRFSLPDDVVRVPLLSIEFYYATSFEFCPVMLYIMNHDLSVPVADPIEYSAVNGWNYLDISNRGITVPHNFYIIIEKQSCGSPVLDDSFSTGRSFKGRYLESLTTPFSYNLLLRAEIGDEIIVPVYEQWSLSITNKMTLKIDGMGTQKVIDEFQGLITLYEDGSVETGEGLFGFWIQREKKFTFYLDPEDIREYITDVLINEFETEPSEVIVTKSTYTGKIKKNGAMKGALKVYTKITTNDTMASGEVILDNKFMEIPDEF
ncbi:MAG: hypothetical protein RDU01_08185 [Thermodesulfovibrionales bacterium]|nr:hypothetical protein [Thermodesulfovibrionales bacterium]